MNSKLGYDPPQVTRKNLVGVPLDSMVSSVSMLVVIQTHVVIMVFVSFTVAY